MPNTQWSAPADQGNAAPFVQSTITAAILDISPGTYLIPAGALDAGVRLRCMAWGDYVATTTASTMTFGFYIGNPGTAITSALALALSSAHTCVVGTLPWMMEFWGVIATESTTTGTVATVNGRGRFSWMTTSWTATYSQEIMPQTVGATVATQTANGLVTYNEQNIFAGCTVTTATGLTSITCDELTCELVG